MSDSRAGTVSRINVYPIKSLPGTVVASSRVLESGALEWDRRLALVDPSGSFINTKCFPELLRIRTDYQLDVPSVRIWTSESSTDRTFHLDNDRESLGDYLTCLLDRPVKVIDNPAGGFPDDTDAVGPTIVSLATLQRVTDLFPEMSLEQTRWRFRTNIEIAGVHPFWEDLLYGRPGQARSFQVGGVTFGGVKPCQRCSVPSRHPVTGEIIQGFATILAVMRKPMIPEGTVRQHFNHYYRLATNMSLLDRGTEGVIRTGDSVTLSAPVEQTTSPELQDAGS